MPRTICFVMRCHVFDELQRLKGERTIVVFIELGDTLKSRVMSHEALLSNEAGMSRRVKGDTEKGMHWTSSPCCSKRSSVNDTRSSLKLSPSALQRGAADNSGASNPTASQCGPLFHISLIIHTWDISLNLDAQIKYVHSEVNETTHVFLIVADASC